MVARPATTAGSSAGPGSARHGGRGRLSLPLSEAQICKPKWWERTIGMRVELGPIGTGRVARRMRRQAFVETDDESSEDED